jgi:hypothetical protein
MGAHHPLAVLPEPAHDVEVASLERGVELGVGGPHGLYIAPVGDGVSSSVAAVGER